MKRLDVIRHIEEHGAEFLKEGHRHTLFVHRANKSSTTVPRHREINPYLVRKICKDLKIPPPISAA